MKIHVDISIFSKEGAVGYSAGSIELETLPRVGERVGFTMPKEGASPPPGFIPSFEVDNVAHLIGIGPSIGLKDVELETKADGLALMRYLEEGFGVFSNPLEGED